MKKLFLTGAAVIMIAVFSGCGGDGDIAPPPPIVTQILSNPASNGDIARDPVTGTLTVTQGNAESVFAGIDPASGIEYRAFLDFPLTGAGGIPGNAIIVSATMDFFVNSILPQPLSGEIPIRIDLVSLPFSLIGTDFDRTLQPALASTTIQPPINQSDFSAHVPVDVTPLMGEAQRRGLLNFRLRVLLDLGAVFAGLIEINDTTGPERITLAPLLEVSYR